MIAEEELDETCDIKIPQVSPKSYFLLLIISRFVIIQITSADHGYWTCLMTMDEDYELVRTYINLQVAVEAVPRIFVDGTESSAVQLKDQNVMNITCLAEKGFPPPVFRWLMTKKMAERVIFMSEQVNI